jgi:hypothetical protein
MHFGILDAVVRAGLVVTTTVLFLLVISARWRIARVAGFRLFSVA